MRYDFNKMLSPKRFRLSKDRKKIDDFYSDRSRIIYSSSFRRLQQKAQVFSLEPNSNVRTRLTHSIEVSDIGRSLASQIAGEMVKRGITKSRDVPAWIVAVVGKYTTSRTTWVFQLSREIPLTA